MSEQDAPMAEQAKRSDLFVCDFPGCNKPYTRLGNLKAHKRTHENIRPYKCAEPGCGANFTHAEYLRTHTRKHTKEKLYQCKLCPEAFSHSSTLTNHIRTHTKERPYKCPFEGCDGAFAQSGGLTLHIRSHTGQRPYACTHPGCTTACTSSGDLKRHIRTHTNERPYKCTVEGCIDAFKESGQLTKHLATHASERIYVCDYPNCSADFTRADVLAEHKKRHSGEKPYLCTFPECDGAFTYSCNLATHMRRHLDERPYLCDFPACGDAFVTSSELKSHYMRHTGEKPYLCDWPDCGAAFAKSSALTTHMRRHRGEKPYVCSTCKAAFPGSTDLYQHARRHHLGPCTPCLAAGRDAQTHSKFAADHLCLECGVFKYGEEAAFRAEYRMVHYLTQRFTNHPAVLKIYLNKQDPDQNKCSKRRPDARIVAVHGTAIAETDEHQHRAGEYTCTAAEIKEKWSELQDFDSLGAPKRRRISEDARLSEIVNSGTIEPTVVWRLNPDAYRDADGQIVDVAEAERLQALGDDIERWLNMAWMPDHFIQVVYMYYDGAPREEDFVPIDGDEYRVWTQKLISNG